MFSIGEQFELIWCGGQEDSAVWYLNTWQWQVRENQPSVLAWLETWCAEAERAIASGYFDEHLEGTPP